MIQELLNVPSPCRRAISRKHALALSQGNYFPPRHACLREFGYCHGIWEGAERVGLYEQAWIAMNARRAEDPSWPRELEEKLVVGEHAFE